MNRDEVQRQLAEVESTIDRVALHSFLGYGDDEKRAGWDLWLDQLRSKRDALRRQLENDEA